MACTKEHCCKGGCYQYCKTVICRGSGGYNSDCRIPVGQIDCLEVLDYTASSCRRFSSFEVDDGILHVRNNCRASFKICSGLTFQKELFPAVPNDLFSSSPGDNKIPTNPNSKDNQNKQVKKHDGNSTNHISKHDDNSTSQNHQHVLTPTNQNNKLGKGTLHTDMTTDMSDEDVVAVDLGIGIGIGVMVAILAVIAFILCRRYHLKIQKEKKNQNISQTVVSSTNLQTGNPLYNVDIRGAVNRTSTLSGRYEEINRISDPSHLSRTLSEPKYESIPSDTLNYRANNNQEISRINSDSSDYQTVADDISSTVKLKQTGSDVVYNSYFRDRNTSNRTSASTSAQYFILDPNETSRESEVNSEAQHTNQSRNDSTKSDTSNTYFVLEKQE